MKVLVNGGLNCSELDGWWAEAYTPHVGWALGDGREHGDDAGWDAEEADRLYTLLETEIVPEFYRRNEAGVPEGWIARVCESLGSLTPEFSANRAVRQYMERHYLPAAQAYLARAQDKGKSGVEVLNWRREVESHWRNLRVAAVKVESDANRHVFTVQVYLDELSADAVRAEVYADPGENLPMVREMMTRGQALAGSGNTYVYVAAVPADRPAEAFTPRIVPYREGASVPLECGEILWAR